MAITPGQQLHALPTLLSDFRPKFDFTNFFADVKSVTDVSEMTDGRGLTWNLQDSRMEGGSDSPAADDEVHSNSDVGHTDTINGKPLHSIIGEDSPSASSPDTAGHGRIASASPRLPSDNNNSTLASQGE